MILTKITDHRECLIKQKWRDYYIETPLVLYETADGKILVIEDAEWGFESGNLTYCYITPIEDLKEFLNSTDISYYAHCSLEGKDLAGVLGYLSSLTFKYIVELAEK